MQIEEYVSLAEFTTFHIGGPARYFVRVRSIAELQEAIAFAKMHSLNSFVLGGGSNVLMCDEGFNGLVIKIEIVGVEVLKEGEVRSAIVSENIIDAKKEIDSDKVFFIVGAGENWDTLVARTVDDGLWGLENLSAIPGSVGGAVVQNIGAYGAAVSETLEWVEVFDAELGLIKKITNTACQFAYRDSIFKHKKNLVVTRAAFALSKKSQPNISYKDLAQRFSHLVVEQGITPDSTSLRSAIVEIRRNKFPDLAVEGSAGSFFKNPIMSVAHAKKLQETYPDMPLFALPESEGVKVPLAWLLDHALNVRGLSVGGARLFEKQLLVIATKPNTSSQDVEELSQSVIEKIKNNFSIFVSPEVHIVKNK